VKVIASDTSRLIGLVILLVTVLAAPSIAQRKKKSGDDAHASGIRLREAEFYFTEGEKFFILEDYSKALLYYQRTLEITPENATVHYKVAEVLAQSNKQEDLLKASISIENALRLEKKNKYFYLLAANIYNNMTAFSKAAAAYETMIREVKGTEEYLYELAAVYQYADKIDEAIKTYDRAESILGVDEVSSIQKLRLYLQQGHNKEAMAECNKLIKAFPDEERIVMGVAETLSQKGLNTEAISLLEEFCNAHPDDSGSAAMLLAGLYRDTQQEQKARKLLTTLFDDPFVELRSKMIILGSYNAELNQNKVNRVSDTDKEKFAISLFEKLNDNGANDPNVHILGGDLYLSLGKNSQALQEYLKAVELGPVNFEVWENLLYLETQEELFDKVIQHSDEALELYPNQRMIHYFNGYAHLRKRHFTEAIASLEQSKRLSSSHPNLVGEISSMLGDAYNATKAFDKSDKAYDDALVINPNNDAVLNNYSYYLALRKTNLEKAERMSSLLIKNNPNNPTFLDTHAWVLYTRQKYKEAKKVIEKALSTGNANATHIEHYGDILFQLGDVTGAVEQWEKARGLNASSETLNKKIANRKIYE
jgi:tetratricopeptide (TPR) repeat protein